MVRLSYLTFLDITIVVDWDDKPQTKQTNKLSHAIHVISHICFIKVCLSF